MTADTSSARSLPKESFLQELLKVLRDHPAGISEYQLIQILEAGGNPTFDTDCLRDNLSLFQTHFFLFHSLYQLREDLRRSGESHLEIGPLCIQLLPFKQSPETALTEHDPLYDYYLDINNLNNTDANDVEALLSKFWRRFVRNDQRTDALAELELSDPVDWTTIKTQHRRLAMQHHPDRGGDEQRLQAINAAMDILTRDARSQQ